MGLCFGTSPGGYALEPTHGIMLWNQPRGLCLGTSPWIFFAFGTNLGVCALEAAQQGFVPWTDQCLQVQKLPLEKSNSPKYDIKSQCEAMCQINEVVQGLPAIIIISSIRFGLDLSVWVRRHDELLPLNCTFKVFAFNLYNQQCSLIKAIRIVHAPSIFSKSPKVSY